MGRKSAITEILLRLMAVRRPDGIQSKQNFTYSEWPKTKAHMQQLILHTACYLKGKECEREKERDVERENVHVHCDWDAYSSHAIWSSG